MSGKAGQGHTADAEAQAKKDPRTVLLIAQELGTDLSVPFEFHYVGIVDRHMHLGLQARGPQPSSQQDLDINSVDAYLGDDSLDLPAYLNRWAESMEHEELRTFASVQLPEDVYELSATAERSFGEGELLIESIDIGRMELKIKFSVRVIRPRIMWHFDVESRGRALSLAPAEISPGVSIRATFIGSV